jgi:hypothetical protein
VSDCTLAQARNTKITFVKVRGIDKEAISTQEKEIENGMDNKPFLSSCRSLNEGNEGMFPPPKYAPRFGGPRKQTNNHNCKSKRHGQASLVCVYYKKKGHRAANCWHSNVCSICSMKGHQVASCWKTQAIKKIRK